MAEFWLDESQKAVLSRYSKRGALSVFGAPGSGKSYTVRALVTDSLTVDPQSKIVVLTTNRRSASELRNQLSLDLGGLPQNVEVRSLAAFAYAIVARFAQFSNRRSPELITGPDQDAILKEAFDIAFSGLPSKLDLSRSGIPNISAEIASLPAFRADFRDFITRAAELQLTSSELSSLAEKHEIPIWELGAQLLDTYENMLASAAGVTHAHPDRVDHARLISLATRDLQIWRNEIRKDGRNIIAKQMPHWNLVIVDDVQNAPLSILELLRQLQKDGAKIVTFGDPDTAIEGYRGGIAYLPLLFTRSPQEKGLGAERVTLEKSYRINDEIARVASQIQAAIHTAGGGTHRQAIQDAVAVSAKSDNNVNALAYTFVTERAQIAYIANEFKRLHLEQGVKYRDMAVITRSAAEHARLRRLFGEFQVNVAPEIATLPLREAPLVRDLIQLIALGIEYESEQISVSIDEVLTGRLFSYPDSRIRRIIRELHGWELHQAGMRTGREILNDITLHPDNEIYAKIPELEKIAQILNIIKQSNERGESAQRILWSIWEQLDLAQELQAQALSSSENASSANDELDAVMQLFRFVQRISEREAETTTLARLLTLLEVQDLPEDSIAKSGDNLDQIALTTAVSTVAKTWKYVAVVNINDGNWPNLKLRNPLTRVPELSSLVIHSLIAGETVKARTLLSEVVDDELRMLLMAVTRASEKLYLSAVDSNESNPSAFFSLLTTSSEVDADTVEVLEEKKEKNLAAKFTGKIPVQHITAEIRAIQYENELGSLRQVVRYGSLQMQEEAKQLIASLQIRKNSVLGEKNNSLDWVDELSLTSEFQIPGKAVVNPSKVETYLKCPLHGFLQQIGARADDESAMHLETGSLIHAICEKFPNGGISEMIEMLDEIWSEYFPDLAAQKYADKRSAMIEMLKRYDEYAKQHIDALKYVEVPAKYIGNDFDVYARIDRIESSLSSPEHAKIIDFKTSKFIPSAVKVQDNAQLRVYQWLINNGCVVNPESGKKFAESIGATLCFVGRGNSAKEQTQNPLNEIQMAEVSAQIAEVAETVKGPYFLAAAESDLCNRGQNSCVFQTICPAYSGKRIFS